MALLSPLLEKLVLSGEAVLRTTVVGHSGHAVVDIAKDKLIIVIEFDYQHFVDYTNPFELSTVIEESVHQIQFTSTKSKNHFIIREPLNTLGENTLFQMTNANGTYKKETFLIHEGTLEVNIIRVPGTIGSTSVVGASPPDLGAEQPPLGYGSGAAAVLSTTNYLGPFFGLFSSEYVPLTRKFTPFAFPLTFNTSQLLEPVNILTALNTTRSVDNFGVRGYPIVNITYVEILRSLATKVFSTS